MSTRHMEIPSELAGGDIPDVLLGYQKRLLGATALSPVTVCEKSRRIGATWAVAADAVLTAAAERAAKGMDVLYIGYNLDMAREFVDASAMWARAFKRAAGAVEEFLFKDQDGEGNDREIQAFRIKFASGFEIVALTSRPRSLRGRQGYVIVDEAAFHDELRELLKAALAMLIWGGKVLVISTHNGDDNPFNELVNDVRAGRKPYGLVRVTFDDALADGLYKRVCLIQRKPWTPEAQAAWRKEVYDFYGDDAAEELDVIPREGSGAWLSAALIEKRMSPEVPVLRWEMPASFAELPDHARALEAEVWCRENIDPVLERLDPRLRSYVGEDFARTGDLTIIWPLQLEANLTRRTPYVVELRNIPFQQQEQIFKYVVDRLPRFMAGALDARGNGQYLAERAMQKYGSTRIAQVMLTTEWYRENMPPYKAAFEDDGIVLPKDADILADHRAIVMRKGVAMPDDSRVKARHDGKQRHADSAIAGALAYHATRMNAPAMEFETAGPGRVGLGAYGTERREAHTDVTLPGQNDFTGYI